MKRWLALVMVAAPAALVALLWTSTPVTAQPVPPPGMRTVTHGSAFAGSGTVASPLDLAPQACGGGSAVSGWGSDGTPACVSTGAPNVQFVSSGSDAVTLSSDATNVVTFTYNGAVSLSSMSGCDSSHVGREVDLVASTGGFWGTPGTKKLSVAKPDSLFATPGDGYFSVDASASPGRGIHVRCLKHDATEENGSSAYYFWHVVEDDSGATYTAGDGLGLSGTVFSLLTGCSDGQIPKRVSGAWACASDGGGSTLSSLGALGSVQLDDWAPSGLAPNATIQVQAGDNQGTLITGISATGFSLGDHFTLCNANGPQDDGVVALGAENTASTASNRIWTPDYGRSLGRVADAVERYTLGSGCSDLYYLQPDASDSSTKRWVIRDQNRFANLSTKQLQLFPYSVPATITGTVNDWVPTDTCPGMGGPSAGSCEAASSTSGNTYSFIYVSTTDSSGATLTGLSYRSSVYADGKGPVRILYNAGPGNVTLNDTDSGSSSMNRFSIRTGNTLARLVLKPGMSVILYHLRDSGGWLVLASDPYLFDAREVYMQNGLSVTGQSANFGGGNATLYLPHSTAGEAKDLFTVYVSDTGTYNTTAAGRTAVGMSSSVTATRSTGSNALSNVALLLAASGSQSNEALRSTAGNVYFGLGSQMTYFYVNTQELSSSGQVKSQGDLTVGQSAFGGTISFKVTATNGHVTYYGTAPTLSGCTSKCTIDAAATDERGRIACTDDSGSDCTVTFASAFITNAPLCSLTFEGSTAPTSTPWVRSVSTTAFTFDQNATGTHAYSYHCDGML